jgi:hypothetical protein
MEEDKWYIEDHKSKFGTLKILHGPILLETDMKEVN